MRRLLNGERVGSFLQVLILLACLASAAAAVGVVLAYHSGWHRAQQGEYQLCTQRETYDQRLHTLEAGDAALMRSMIVVDKTNQVFATVRRQRDAAFERKLRLDEAYLATPVVDGCELVKP